MEFVTDGDWGLRAAGHFPSFPSNQPGMLCCHVNTTQNLLLKLHPNLLIIGTAWNKTIPKPEVMLEKIEK